MLKFNHKITLLYFLLISNSIYCQLNIITVKGFVFDDKTNEKLVGVFISISDSGVAVTNQDGYFSFKVEAGDYKVTAGMIGYEKVTKKLLVDKTEEETKLFFWLKTQPIEITQVTVTGEQFTEKIKYQTYNLQAGDFRKIPQFGEADALRALQVLPGVSSINDFSSQLFIRGGNFDETLITLDEVPVYNPYHLGSFFSMFNTEIIESQSLYPSNYPNRYGGYLSGILSIHSKSGNVEQLKGSASIGLLSAKGYVETKFGKSSLVVSARRTYFDLLVSLFSNYEFPYNFYDLFGKYTYIFDEKNYISSNFFYSKDIFKIYNETYYLKPKVQSHPNWGNKLWSLNYTHLYGKNNIFQLLMYNTSAKMDGKGESLYESNQLLKSTLFINNVIDDISSMIKINHSFIGHEIEAGLEYKNIKLDYNWEIGSSELSDFGFKLQDTFFDFAPRIYNSFEKTFFLNYFVSDKILLNTSLNFSFGLRGSFIKHLDKNFITPFINLKFKFNESVDIIFSYGKYLQNLFVIKDQNRVLLDPFSIYFLPSNQNQIPSSNNFSSSLVYDNLFNEVDLEINTYYNFKKNLPSTYSHDIDRIKFENGYATGFEVLIREKNEPLNYLVSYSFARSIKSNQYYNYYSRSDRTHSVKMLFNYSISESWFLTSYWTFVSGLLFTPAIGKYVGGEVPILEIFEYDSDHFYWFPIEGNKNSKRTDNYHRLDLGISGSFIWGPFYVKPYLQILNVYNSPNAIFDDQNLLNLKRTRRGSSIIPTIGLTIDF